MSKPVTLGDTLTDRSQGLDLGRTSTTNTTRANTANMAAKVPHTKILRALAVARARTESILRLDLRNLKTRPVKPFSIPSARRNSVVGLLTDTELIGMNMELPLLPLEPLDRLNHLWSLL